MTIDKRLLQKLGWVAPGKPLSYAQKIAAARPGKVFKGPPSLVPERVPPATPFLCLPESTTDVGSAPRTRWASSPALYLLNVQGGIEPTLRMGASYRTLALIRNSGSVPTYNGFAEFVWDGCVAKANYFQAPDINPVNDFDPLPSLGISAFSAAPGELTWALSPSWFETGTGPASMFVAVRVFDPVFDGRSTGWRSRIDRKVALNIFGRSVHGTWSGKVVWRPAAGPEQELDSEITISIDSGPFPQEQPDGTVQPQTATVRFSEIRPGNEILFTSNTVLLYQDYFRFLDVAFDPLLGTNTACWWNCTIADASTMLVKAELAAGKIEAVLKPVGTVGAAPSNAIDTSLLRNVRQTISPTWSASRQTDARQVYDAISRLP